MEEAHSAVEKLNGIELEGRAITIKAYQPIKRSRSRSRSRSRERSRKFGTDEPRLYVGNLPYSMTWQQLKDIFKKYASVEKADIALTKDVICL